MQADCNSVAIVGPGRSEVNDQRGRMVETKKQRERGADDGAGEREKEEGDDVDERTPRR